MLKLHDSNTDFEIMQNQQDLDVFSTDSSKNDIWNYGEGKCHKEIKIMR